MKDFVYYNELFEIYGELLTEKEQENFKDYYFEDLSLSEIASNKKVSRAAIQKTLKNVINKLDYYESIIHKYKINSNLKESLNFNDLNKIKETIEKIINL